MDTSIAEKSRGYIVADEIIASVNGSTFANKSPEPWLREVMADAIDAERADAARQERNECRNEAFRLIRVGHPREATCSHCYVGYIDALREVAKVIQSRE